MNIDEDIIVACPQCGEEFAIQVDTSGGSYETIEDCAVCCRPMTVAVRCSPGEIAEVSVEAC